MANNNDKELNIDNEEEFLLEKFKHETLHVLNS
jgi:hypothetical protein